jgi:hypothetical protein
MKKPFHSVPLVLALAAGAGLAGRLEAQSVQVRAQVSDALPHYKPEIQIKGALEIPCTDALSDLGDEWNRGYRKFQPQASLVFLAKLSAEAATALVSGKAPLVILARELTAG